MNPAFDPTLLSRIEDAGLNASAPPQQRWMDGWLLRFSPGKAKRARCINAVSDGRLPIGAKLALCEPVFSAAELPLIVRITPFSRPLGLDAYLEQRGMERIDDTRVMVCATLDGLPPARLPPGCRLERVGHHAFAQAVGQLRGSPLVQRQAHAERLEHAPVPFQGWIVKDEDAIVIACGQMALEAELVGVYDVYTAVSHRGRGIARGLCLHLLHSAREQGGRVGYLQVEGDNHPARKVYQGIGFADAYAYHYRGADGG
ncbi:MAG: GNAT family N-acetyltransferase [Proteobacteria bacterium]|nr:GNAT family N-acetyltransferase [Pseudomonadota bacterium]